MTGVMPIIFAQAIVSIPATLALIFTSWQNGINTWFSAASRWPFYAIVYFLMIIAFAYFYNSISFNPVEVANNIRKNGGTILGLPSRQADGRLHQEGSQSYHSHRRALSRFYRRVPDRAFDDGNAVISGSRSAVPRCCRGRRRA